MKNYPNILSVKMNDKQIEQIDQYCTIEEQTRSGVTRLALKEFLRSPKVVATIRKSEPVDFMM
jgi:hypothetical protein